MTLDGAPILDASGLPRVVAAGLEHVPEGSPMPAHELAYLEINLICSGRYRLRLNGEAQIAEAGGAYLYLPGDVASATSEPGDGELVCRWVKFTWPESGRGGEPLTLARECRLDPAEQARAIAAFDRMHELLVATPQGWRVPAAAHLIDIVAIISHACARHATPPPSIDRRIATGIAYMQRHLVKPMLIAEVATASGLAEDYFTRLFRKQLGIPPMQHLIRLRLQEARRMLVEQDLTILAIARRCGFDDPGHFTRLFRRHYGVPPREFRSRLSAH